MKSELKQLLAIGLSVCAFGLAHAMTIQVWWADGSDVPIKNEVPVEPSTFTGSPEKAPTFVCNPPLGHSFSYWMRRRGNPLSAWSKDVDWFSDENPLTATYDSSDGTTTFYLVARVDWYSYNLAFDTLGGSNPPTNEVLRLVFSNQVSFAAYDGVKKGYRFEGWTNSLSASAAPLTGAFTVDGGSLGVTNADAVVTLAAKWAGVRYRLDYDLGGGSYGERHPDEGVYGEKLTVSNPSRLGYVFKEWDVLTNGVSMLRVTPVSGEATFLNLSDREGASVTLRAVWEGARIKVKFNNNGASSGTVTFEEKEVVYGQPYDGVNPPSRSGASFGGYYVDTTWCEVCWDRYGQPAKTSWDIATNLTVIAKWEVSQLWIKYALGEGVTGKIDDMLVDYDEEVTLSDGIGVTKPGCELLGWAENDTATVVQYELGGKYRFKQSVTLYPVWKYLYYVAFDGQGATSGQMAVQEFVRGEAQALESNAFAKIGYAFVGWATNEADAAAHVWRYADGAVLAESSAAPGSTNSLFAVWSPNVYFVAFDPGEGTGEMTVQRMTYDQPANLDKCTFKSPSDLYVFKQWVNADRTASYADGAEVINLCAESDATNRLTAVWKLDVGEWSEAMHCTTGRWLVHNEGSGYDLPWSIREGPGLGKDGSGSCVTQDGFGNLPPTDKQWLALEVPTNGTLSLWCRWESQPTWAIPQLLIGVSESDYEFAKMWGDPAWGQAVPVVAVDTWTNVIFEVKLPAEQTKAYVHLASFADSGDVLHIDQVTWTPAGSRIDPTDENAVTISSVAISEGAFNLFFKSDERFGYNLLTNANLLIDSWGVMTYKPGTGATVTFEPEIQSGVPQMFYKVETIRKK